MGLFSKKPAAPKKAKPAAKKTEDKKAEAKKTEAPKSEEKTIQLPATTGDAHRVLIRPIVTEKSSALASHGTYVFVVASSANKHEIKKAVKAVYGATATDVRVMNVQGKVVRSRGGFGRRKDWRKAVVTLKEGQSIDVLAHA